MQRVGIDLRIVHYAKTGFARYAQGLIASLKRFPQNDTRFILLHHPDDAAPAPADSDIEEVAFATPLFCSDEGERIRREVAPLALDTIHFPFSLFPGRAAERVILTMHDLTCKHFPQHIEPTYLSFYCDALRAAGEADRIIAVSQRVADELAGAGLPRHKIHVCYPLTPFEATTLRVEDPIDRELVDRLGSRPFILSIGSLEPRKNFLAAVAAFTRLRRRVAEPIRLILVGQHGWLMEPLLAACARNPYREDIWLVRDANDATVQHLLRHCRLYLNCSLYEGFGLPMLEALAEHACVLSTPVPSLLESGFPREGILETADADAVATRLADLLTDDTARGALAERSRTVVGGFYRSGDPARLAKMYAL